ncbi:TIGR01244 family phosphatase [Pseudomonas entomophila]|uniref:bifunctional protein tyrosine phosphatase family protein/NAD(P)/FAD-dependent oxidoreductase n=1 Tax=Pseudomonas entomophila TaxID=312306 RepID=UPI0015E2F294|nr:bifunctional protein tyrosine phosphatase family protein/NAD(P)/FAD-dependent oxidoreductase [Pseudomonas entomophila]MBA1191028.1 TIGR01244 family phosphatase [Pseudomonas entomophila]
MQCVRLDEGLFVASQVQVTDLPALHQLGIRSVICNRPDGEAPDQPSADEIATAACAFDIAFSYIPVGSEGLGDERVATFTEALTTLPGPTLAYCRTGNRSASLWALSRAGKRPAGDIIASAKRAGFDVAKLAPRLEAAAPLLQRRDTQHYDVVIVGAGAGGLSACASLLKRRKSLNLCLVDPATSHYYQPGWTLVGAGVFKQEVTERSMASLIPSGVTWEKASVTTFEPECNRVELDNGRLLTYDALIVAPGIELDWEAIPGLAETLGRNGVTSNYRFDLAPYTWELVRTLRRGRALFTQPPMPIKCAGAPQKAMYLSADHWLRVGALDDIDIEFHTATPALFGVAAYVPALMEYVERYQARLNVGSTLTAVNGADRVATFSRTDATGQTTEHTRRFDLLHVCPPQKAPDFIRNSPLSNEAGWVDVDQDTLCHLRYANIFALGDASSTPNAKTAAAARKQAPVVADNTLAYLEGKPLCAVYDGYGSCPLTVERGKIVLAEFGYGGKILPTFPRWLLDGKRPSRLAWHLKTEALPRLYWDGMLKGREWLCTPARRTSRVVG